MKYLKTYKIFEEVGQNLKDDIKDILLELTDMGYQFDAQWHKSTNNHPYVLIERSKLDWDEKNNKYVGFNHSDIKEVIDRIKDVAEEAGWEIEEDSGYSWVMITFK